jgi:hypothetical protein
VARSVTGPTGVTVAWSSEPAVTVRVFPPTSPAGRVIVRSDRSAAVTRQVPGEVAAPWLNVEPAANPEMSTYSIDSDPSGSFTSAVIASGIGTP